MSARPLKNIMLFMDDPFRCAQKLEVIKTVCNLYLNSTNISNILDYIAHLALLLDFLKTYD